MVLVQPVRTFVSTQTDPARRGHEFGAQHPTEIASTVAAYRALFDRRAGGHFDTDRWGERAWATIADQAPDAADEIAGMARGAGVEVRELAALNARTELLAIADPTGLVECSTVVALPPDRPPIAVQTWDWYDAMAAGWLHWTVPNEDGHVVETVTEYGVLAKIGVSTRGLAVMLNMLHHRDDDQRDLGDDARVGLPVHLLSRRLLERAESTEQAAELVRDAKVSASTSLTVVDTDGDAASFELFPGGPGVVRPQDGLLVRTNHFVSDEGVPGCVASEISEGTRIRRRVLLERLTSQAPATPGDVVTAMDHHVAPLGSVCAHPDPRVEPLLRHATLATVSLDVTTASLDVRRGGPCGR